MTNEIQCPTCGGVEWKAVEQFTSLTPCRLEKNDSQVEVIFDSRAEFQREASTSVTTMYLCAQEDCGFSVEPARLNTLGG